jgi:hypothetical protein
MRGGRPAQLPARTACRCLESHHRAGACRQGRMHFPERGALGRRAPVLCPHRTAVWKEGGGVCLPNRTAALAMRKFIRAGWAATVAMAGRPSSSRRPYWGGGVPRTTAFGPANQCHATDVARGSMCRPTSRRGWWWVCGCPRRGRTGRWCLQGASSGSSAHGGAGTANSGAFRRRSMHKPNTSVGLPRRRGAETPRSPDHDNMSRVGTQPRAEWLVAER